MSTDNIAISYGEAGVSVLEIAKALGLKTENLSKFQLTVTATEVICVDATYQCRNGDIERLRHYISTATSPAPPK